MARTKVKAKMPETIRLEVVIETPTFREETLTAELRKLPGVSVAGLNGYKEFCAACSRLQAAEQAGKQAEEAMTNSCQMLRIAIAKLWSPAEVPNDLRALMQVW